MTDEELQVIEARATAAAPGPWEATLAATVQLDMIGPRLEHRYEDDGTRVPYVASEDAAFIASARTDVPALVAEVRRLRKSLARLGSMEAMTMAFGIQHDDPGHRELVARIDYARDALKMKT